MIRKENQLLAELVRARQIQPESAEWLKCVTDPFHDTDFDPTGYPDTECGATITQLVKQSLNISAATFGGLGGGNWDLQAALLPFMGNSALTSIGALGANGEYTTSAMPGNLKLANLVLIAVPAGGRMSPGVITPIDAGARFLSLGTVAYSKGWSRLIGQAFEIANTTATLSKQGSVTVFKKNATVETDTLTTLVGGATSIQTPHRVAACWPANIAEAELLAGSRTWDAAEGCYVVQAMNALENPLKCPNGQPVFLADEDPNGVPVANVGIVTPTTVRGRMNNDATSGTMQMVPFDISGAFFQGLSAASTLKLTLRSIIERAPTSNEPDLVVMAKPSPSWDSEALSAYSKCMRVMPPGVPLAENFTGDWFKSVLKTIGQYAPAVSKALVAVPAVGGSLSALVGGVGSAAQAATGLWGSGSANSRKPKPGGANGGHVQNPPGTGKRSRKKWGPNGPQPPADRSNWYRPEPQRDNHKKPQTASHPK